MSLLIKNVRLVDYTSDFNGDIYIEQGKIKEIGKKLEKTCETIDGKNKVLMPAFVDLHAHFRDPGYTKKEDIESGSKASVKGGYTTLNLMANTNPICSSMETARYVREKAKKVNLVDIHQVVSITKNFDGKTLTHLDEIDDEVKWISDDGVGVNNSKVMTEAMNIAKKKNIGLMLHEEDISTAKTDTYLSEELMTFRDVKLANLTKARVHFCHVSTIESINHLIEGKKQGDNITFEVTPHHIALNDETHYKVNPPLRSEEHRKYIIKAIKDGHVDAIATDHAPHSVEDKKKGAMGITGIETAFSTCYTYLTKEKHISLRKLSELMSKNPGDILKINKGRLDIGYDGDLVLVDIEKKYTVDKNKLVSKGKNTPMDKKELYGEVVMTFKKGVKVYEKYNG